MFFINDTRVTLETLNTIKVNGSFKVNSVKLDANGKNIDLLVIDGLYKLPFELNLHQKNYVIINEQYRHLIEIGMVTTTQPFDEKYYYDGSLGVDFTSRRSVFKLWSPVATDVILVVFDDSVNYSIKMTGNGIFYEGLINHNVEGFRYYYLVEVNGKYEKVIDPYAYSLSLNAQEAYIVDISKIDTDVKYHLNDKDKMVIYETSIRDFTTNLISDETSGKFTSFPKRGLKTTCGNKAGIDHVIDLGVSHIQLMPMSDFGSVDEKLTSDIDYNWGYDPTFLNVPEGSYVVNVDPYARINEPKEMINELKSLGFGVFMDVVYNHVYDKDTFVFDVLCPNYYYRFDGTDHSDGSFCGNEVASERRMVRRYIIDTCRTWVELYGVDGFRVDLMGLMDLETLQILEKEMKKIHNELFIYGEGWSMPSSLDQGLLATQVNANEVPSVAFFNDCLRDFIKGSNSDYEDIVIVKKYLIDELNNMIANDIENVKYDKLSLEKLLGGYELDNKKSYVSHEQLINYLSCHDDHTLFDYLILNQQSDEEIKLQILVAYELLFKAKGITFIHCGCEFLRSKNGAKNTYNSSATINAIDWDLIDKHEDVVQHVKKLIKMKIGE